MARKVTLQNAAKTKVQAQPKGDEVGMIQCLTETEVYGVQDEHHVASCNGAMGVFVGTDTCSFANIIPANLPVTNVREVPPKLLKWLVEW